MSFENTLDSSASRFFKKYIDNSVSLSKIIDRKTEVNKYYLESNLAINDHRIFIFFNTIKEGLDHYNNLISRFNDRLEYLKIDVSTIASWFDKYNGDILCHNLENCVIMFSKGVSLFRIDIYPVKLRVWNNINGKTNQKNIEFGFPFSSPVDHNLPEFNNELDLNECIMLLSVFYQLQGRGSLEFSQMNSFYNQTEFEEFVNSKIFKDFTMYFIFNVFNNSIDIFETPALKKVFDTIFKSFSKFKLLELSLALIYTTKKEATFKKVENSVLKALLKKMEIRDVVSYFQLRMNKYFKIQDGEFVLFAAMNQSNESVFKNIDSSEKEILFNDMVHESNSRATELRKSLIGDIPMNLNDRPTSLSVKTNKNDDRREYDPEAIKYNNSGSEKLKSQDFEGAIEDFQKAVDLDPYILPCYISLSGLIINIHQDYNRAVDLTSKIIELEGFEKTKDVNYAQIYDNRGLAKSYLENEEEAILDFNEALKIDDSRGLTYTNRGFSYIQIGENELALEDLNKAVDIDNTIPNIYFNRSKCRQSLGDFKGSLEDCNIAIEKDPENFNILQHKMFLDTLFESGLGDTLSNLKED